MNRPSTIRTVAAVMVATLVLLVVAWSRGIGGDPWIRHGFTEKQRVNVRKTLRQGVTAGHVAGGALTLTHRGEEVFAEGFGYADIASEEAFTLDHPVRMASLSKPITATVFGVMVDKGWLDWDKPIGEWLPEFRRPWVRDGQERVTAPSIRQILAHEGGLPPNQDIPSDKRPLLNTMGPQGVVDLVNQLGLAYEPGTKELYSGAGFQVAARCAELAHPAGDTDFEEIAQELVIKPLSMHRSTFRPRKNLIDKMPTLYRRTDDGFKKQPRLPAHLPPDAINPAGGFVTSARDLTRFYQMHWNDGEYDGLRLLQERTALEMRRPQSRSKQYGLGFHLERVGEDDSVGMIKHGGLTGTFAWMDFENDLVGVLLTQTLTQQNRDFRFALVGQLTEYAVRLKEKRRERRRQE